MSNRRALAMIAATRFLLTGCGRSETEKVLATYDPAEVQMLRDQAKDGGLEADDALLLDTLLFRDDCRTIRAALKTLAAGQQAGEAMDRFTALADDNRKRGQSAQADYFQTMVDKALLGDPAQAKSFHEQDCSTVK